MARAFNNEGVECRVHVDKDLGDSWAVTVEAPPAGRADPTLKLVVKLQGEDREKVTAGALEILQKSGQISRFEL